ncbi:hypothetical protein [Pseudarthrobacter enclensis]|uniref:hypothetical protein n=1 Tax=Pseudarthrobacter enclensis TaxID=993070 RepID=UPI003EE073BE
MAARETHDWRPVWARLHEGSGGQEPEALVLAVPGDVNLPPALPSEFALIEAPMEDYDIVELSRFDRPLARVMLSFGDGFAVLGPVLAVGEGEILPEHEAAVLAAAAEEAYIEGASILYAPVPKAAVQRYEQLGWTRADTH